jgi:hypothetical protein
VPRHPDAERQARHLDQRGHYHAQGLLDRAIYNPPSACGCGRPASTDVVRRMLRGDRRVSRAAARVLHSPLPSERSEEESTICVPSCLEGTAFGRLRSACARGDVATILL